MSLNHICTHLSSVEGAAGVKGLLPEGWGLSVLSGAGLGAADWDLLGAGLPADEDGLLPPLPVFKAAIASKSGTSMEYLPLIFSNSCTWWERREYVDEDLTDDTNLKME